MATSGNPNTISFTPAVAAILELQCMFDGQRTTGGDFGTGAQCQLFMSQGGATIYGDVQYLGNSHLKYALQYVFSVAAGLPVTCGLTAGISGASALTFSNIELKAELIKR